MRVSYLESYKKKPCKHTSNVSNRHSRLIIFPISLLTKFKKRTNFDVYFYNNCVISPDLIGSFLSSIRIHTEQILTYESFQQFNFQLSNCQLLTMGFF